MAEHYFSATPSSPFKPSTVQLRLADLQLTLRSDRGVFSGDRVDPGTMALLKVAPYPPSGGQLLDLGCGYGPIACALAFRSPGATVWAVDVNTRALALVAANAEALHLANVHPTAPDEVPAGVLFDGIWSNPPVRVGKPTLHHLLSRWLGRLAPDGLAWLVVNRHLGGDSLATWLEGEGWTVSRAASKSGYRVLRVARPGPGGAVPVSRDLPGDGAA